MTIQREPQSENGGHSVFSDPARIEVQFAMSIHNASASRFSDEARFHLVLKFYYSKRDMIHFVEDEEVPGDDVEFMKEYGTNRRFFPYTLVNAVCEYPSSWSYHNKEGRGQIYERIEVFYHLMTHRFVCILSSFTVSLLDSSLSSLRR